jgi:ferredoxin-NADP reductase
MIVFSSFIPDSWLGCRGLICADDIISLMPDYLERTFYVCGPPAMVTAMEKLLTDLGIKEENTIIERFGGY